MSIQQITESIWPDILELQSGAYLSVDPENLDVLQSKWLRSPETCFVYQGLQQILGYLLAHSWNSDSPPKLFNVLPENTDGQILFVHDLAISEQAKGQGIGQSMVDHLVAKAKLQGYGQIRLVAVQNSSVFWLKQGFQPLDQKVCDSYGEGALMMVREI